MVDACDAEAVITSCLPTTELPVPHPAPRTHAVAVVSSSLGSIIHDTVKPSPIVCRPSCAKALVAGRPARWSPPRRRTGSRASSTVSGAYKRAWSRIITDESRPWSTLWPRATAARAQRVGHRSRGQVQATKQSDLQGAPPRSVHHAPARESCRVMLPGHASWGILGWVPSYAAGQVGQSIAKQQSARPGKRDPMTESASRPMLS